MADVVTYGRSVCQGGAGNCLEYCAAAAVYLSGRQDGLQPGGANAAVLDPWLGISVKARHYPEIWRMKLDVMAAGGEELGSVTG
jgi:hypothetical protein